MTRMRRISPAVIAALAVGACGAAAAADATGPPHAAAVKACRTSNLQPSKGASQGAAGTFYLRIRLHNAGARCKTFGYPGVSLVASSGKRIPTTAHHRGTPHRHTLPHGANAYFRVSYAEVPMGSGPCTRVRRVRLIAPDDTHRRTLFVTNAGEVCRRPGKRGSVNVYPITRP
jgi:hypothetical protein